MRVSTRWSVQANKGKLNIVTHYYDQTGKYKTKWLATGLNDTKSNRKQIQKTGADIVANWWNEFTSTEKEEPVVLKVKTVKEVAEEWLRVHSGSIDAVTAQGYDNLVRVHIVPRLGSLTLDEVTLPVLDEAVQFWQTSGNVKTNKGLSPKSIKMILVALGQIGNHAVSYGYISQNFPIDKVTRPKLIPRRDLQTLTGEDVARLISSTRGTQIGVVIILAAYYGLRRSEILGLKWGAIDFDSGVFVVKSTVSRVTGPAIHKDKTKTESSFRSFPISGLLREELEKLKKDEAKDEDYVFLRDDGNLLTGDQITERVKKAAAKLGLDTTPHKLRHTCATLLMTDAGVGLRDVQGWLGHADIQTTANIYGHIDAARKQAIANRMDKVISF